MGRAGQGPRGEEGHRKEGPETVDAVQMRN